LTTDSRAAYRLDHVIVFVDDLARAERSFAERLGLVATSHATHPGFGTRNARNACSAWSASNAKSRRPWIMNTGTWIWSRLDATDRAAR